jgi:hypothetical protein
VFPHLLRGNRTRSFHFMNEQLIFLVLPRLKATIDRLRSIDASVLQ